MPAGPISEAYVAILPLINEAAFSAEVETGVEGAVARVGGKAFAPLEAQAAKAGQRAGVALDESFSKTSSVLAASAAKAGTKAGAALDASFGKAVAPLGKEAAVAGEKASAAAGAAGAAATKASKATEKGASSGLAKLGLLAGGYELVTHSIEVAKQRQLDQIRSVEVFGEKSQETIRGLVEETAKSTIQSVETTTEAFNAVGAKLQAVGITQQQSVGLSEKLVKRIGDVSAKTGKSVDDLVKGVSTSLASGSTRALRDLGVVADNSDIAFAAAKNGLVQLKGQVPQLASAQEKVTAAQQAYNDAVKKSGAGSKEALSAKAALDKQNVALEQTRAKYADVAKTLPQLVSQQRVVTKAQEDYKKAVDKFGPSSDKARAAQKRYNNANAIFLASVKAQVPPLTKQQKALALTDVILTKTASSQGAAEKRSHTFSGAVQRLKVTFSNLEETIGSKLIPVFTRLLNGITAFFGFLEAHKTVTKVLVDSLTALAALLLLVKVRSLTLAAAEKIVTAAEIIWADASKLVVGAQAALNAVMDANPIFLVVAAAAALAIGFIELYKHSKTFRDILQAIGRFMKTVFLAALHAVEVAFKTVGHVIENVFHKVQDVVITVFHFIRDHWKLLAAILLGPFGLAIDFIVSNFPTIRAVIGRVIGAVKSVLRGLHSFITGVIIPVFDRVKSVVQTVFGGLKTAVSEAVGFVTPILNALKKVLDSVFGTIGKVLGGIGKIIHGGGSVLHKLHVPGFAEGGIVDSATLALVGEAGREVVIPMTNKKRAFELANQSGLLDLLVAQANHESRGTLSSVTKTTDNRRTTTNNNTFILPAVDPNQHAQMVGHRLEAWSTR